MKAKEVFDGARLVKFNEDYIAYVWHGGLTVNIFILNENNDWLAIDCFTMHPDEDLSYEFPKKDPEDVEMHINDFIDDYTEYVNSIDC